MNSKNYRQALAALAFVGVAGACDAGLTDVNRNPNSPETVPVENVLASGILDLAANETGVGAFGEWTTLYHTELWSQHLAQAQYNDEDKYSPRAGVPTQIWDNGYAGALRDLMYVKQVAEETEDDDLWAVAEILSVYQFLMLTDLFGDVPYSEALALDREIQNPKYDSQQAIYPDLITRLEAAVAMIDRAETDAPFSEGDFVYEGDMSKWYKFGNSLVLRIATRMSGSGESPTSLAGAARTAFAAAWNRGVIGSNADNATIAWPGEQPVQNPAYEQIVLGSRSGDFRVSDSLVDRLEATNDPRLEVYADPAVSDGVFRGLRNGLTPPDYDIPCTGGSGCTNGLRSGGAADFSTLGEYFLEADAPSVLMSRAEVLFLAAEAAARGWITGSAEQQFRAAITASLDQYDITDAAFVRSIAFNGLPSIYEQKWVALYMAGPEPFNEFRRTGYPELVSAENSVLPGDLFPARLPYPTEEALYNPDNFPTVELEDPLFWAVVNR